MDDTRDVLGDFDPHEQSFVDLYASLIERSPHPEASDVAGDTERLREIDARFAALPKREVAPELIDAPEVAVTSQAAALQRWGNYNVSGTFQYGDWPWFPDNFCRSWTDFCEVGYHGARSQGYTSRSAVSRLFNEDLVKNDGQLILLFDPCKGVVGTLCTKPYKALITLNVPQRRVYETGTWTSTNADTIRWSVHASGTWWGWALVFDN